MIRDCPFLCQSIAGVLTLSMFKLSLPYGEMQPLGAPLLTSNAESRASGDALASLMRNFPRTPPLVFKKRTISRELTAEEMKTMSGSAGKCPYLAGQQKWDVFYKGINMFNGTYTTSATDLSFEGGIGIPIAVTRTYNSNNDDEGPLGVGWALSVDIRTTAGGLLKSGSAPVRSVPTNFKMRSSFEDDPRVGLQGQTTGEPAEAVVACDGGGFEETIQRDIDGILTTPGWDANVNKQSNYETVEMNGKFYQVLTHSVMLTPEGTTYVYDKHGVYTSGMRPFNEVTPDFEWEPSNVLKISTVTDRHGNVTTYNYSSSVPDRVNYSRVNGAVWEDRLLSITTMPTDRTITFTWANVSGKMRITAASDGTRTVNYGYTNGLLTSAQTPGGKTTSYTYGGVDPATGGPPGVEVSTDLLKTITDPRGLTTKINYVLTNVILRPYNPSEPAPVAYKLEHPNGVITYFKQSPSMTWPAGNPPAYINQNAGILETVGGGSGSAALFTLGFNTVTSGQYVGGKPCVQVWFNWVPGPPSDGAYKMVWYDLQSQALLKEQLGGNDGLWYETEVPESWLPYMVDTETLYNFLGNPLKKTVKENDNAAMSGVDRTFVTEYAYHPSDKYYQQKAVLDPAGRMTYTEYFNNAAAQGYKGQVSKVYNSKFGGVVYTGPLSTWRTNVGPADVNDYAAKYDYNSCGQPIDVWKLQNTNGFAHNTGGTAWSYVRTHTDYNAPTTYAGAPLSVSEDFGGINRLTSTNIYDAVGRAVTLTDASGKTFENTYSADGEVLGVDWTNSPTGPVDVVTYTYGTSQGAITNGMVTQVVDALQGVTQDITYHVAQTGTPPGIFAEDSLWGAVGQVKSIVESRTGTSYEVRYRYNSAGERCLAEYLTPNTQVSSGKSAWRYKRYTHFGTVDNVFRVFRSLIKQSWGGTDGGGNNIWNDTSEEVRYGYDPNGRLVQILFAQTPQYGQTGYDILPALRRLRQINDYDSAGRVINTRVQAQHYMEDWGYQTPIPVFESTYGYFENVDTSTTNDTVLPMRDRATITHYMSGDQFTFSSTVNTAWNYTEKYKYDTKLDYLTSASYDNGSTWRSWTYDTAANRASDSGNPGVWLYDNLNRITASPGFTYQHDILGNRTVRLGAPTAQGYGWDAINRAGWIANATQGASYRYRADGMRVEKAEGFTATWNGSSFLTAAALQRPTTRFFYDGQILVEDDLRNVGGSGPVMLTRNGIGARGVDYMAQYSDSTLTTEGFPIYDGHGDMVATSGRSMNGFGIADARSYDVWGSVRGGYQSGNPKQRYCANFGHIQDDESGLIYMRARYYEPWTGRFLSEDSSKDGLNWFAYGNNNPVACGDRDGHFVEMLLIAIILFLAGEMLMAIMDLKNVDLGNQIRWLEQLMEMEAAASSLGTFETGKLLAENRARIVTIRRQIQKLKLLKAVQKGAEIGHVILKLLGYSLILEALLIDIDLGPDGPGSLDILYGG